MIKNLNKKTKSKGFTLIELIIVIAIIGILAAVALPKFGAVRMDAKVNGDVANAKIIANAVTMLMDDGTIVSSPTAVTVTDDQLKTQLQSIPTSEVTGAAFVVKVTGGNITVDSGTAKFYPEYVAPTK